MIDARLTTDDGHYDVGFDAQPAFEAFADAEALANTLADLDRHAWTGGPAAGRIARYLRGRPGQDRLTSALDQAERTATTGKSAGGFTCRIDQDGALAWTRESAPEAWELFAAKRPENPVVRAARQG